MEFSVLGSLRVRENGHDYAPTAPKQRQLLALLVFNANQVVTVGTCIEELWGESPPDTGLSTLQSYVLQLRRILKRVPRIGSLKAARELLQTRDGGYLLAVRPEELDVNLFHGLVRQGRAELGKNDVAASELLSTALGLWEGSALSDVQAGPVLRIHLAGLEETRVSVQEQRIDADLRLGRHHDLLGELSALCALYPTHENLHAQFMLALSRSGRRHPGAGGRPAAAQDAGRRARARTVPRMNRLHQAVLACDPVIDAPTRTAPLLSLDLLAHSGARSA